MKRILITGANSYIGSSFEKFIIENYSGSYVIDSLDMLDSDWKEYDFSSYDTVFHVAGIAHQKETKENLHLYYKINRDLSIQVADKARNEHVRQFIFLSTMSVYGNLMGEINLNTKPNPISVYGKSKLEAELILQEMSRDDFKVCILRPPMVYGRNCKGNYQLLRKFALKTFMFPNTHNKRSMIFIDNLTYFIKWLIDKNKSGIYLPQNTDYVNTAELVKLIAKYNGKKLYIVPFSKKILTKLPMNVIKKVFGDLTYNCNCQMGYKNLFESFEETIKLSEKER